MTIPFAKPIICVLSSVPNHRSVCGRSLSNNIDVFICASCSHYNTDLTREIVFIMRSITRWSGREVKAVEGFESHGLKLGFAIGVTVLPDRHPFSRIITMLTQVLPSTLPFFKYPAIKDSGDPWQKAYRTCLQHEAQAETQVDFMRARVLGYVIREAPNNESRDTICHDINSCHEYSAFCDLANGYIRFLAQLCEYKSLHHVAQATHTCDDL